MSRTSREPLPDHVEAWLRERHPPRRPRLDPMTVAAAVVLTLVLGLVLIAIATIPIVTGS